MGDGPRMLDHASFVKDDPSTLESEQPKSVDEIFGDVKKSGADILGIWTDVESLVDVTELAFKEGSLLTCLDCVLRVQELVSQETYPEYTEWVYEVLDRLSYFHFRDLVNGGWDPCVLDNLINEQAL